MENRRARHAAELEAKRKKLEEIRKRKATIRYEHVIVMVRMVIRVFAEFKKKLRLRHRMRIKRMRISMSLLRIF